MTDLEIIAIFFTFLASLIIIPSVAADIHTKYIQKKD